MKRCLLLILVCTTCLFAGSRDQELVAHVKLCILLAEKNTSQVSPKALRVPGLTGNKVRHLLNNLCTLPAASYLEIGCFRGSTLVAALYHNESSVQHAVAIDNWSEFGGPKKQFLKNIQTFLPLLPLHFFEVDCFAADLQACLPVPVNIYFYDGHHSAIEQEMAFTYFNDAFEDTFIAVVDDWNGSDVKAGTFAAFGKLKYDILYDREFSTQEMDPNGWWNGIYIAVIRKPDLRYTESDSRIGRWQGGAPSLSQALPDGEAAQPEGLGDGAGLKVGGCPTQPEPILGSRAV